MATLDTKHAAMKAKALLKAMRPLLPLAGKHSYNMALYAIDQAPVRAYACYLALYNSYIKEGLIHHG